MGNNEPPRQQQRPTDAEVDATIPQRRPVSGAPNPKLKPAQPLRPRPTPATNTVSSESAATANGDDPILPTIHANRGRVHRPKSALPTAPRPTAPGATLQEWAREIRDSTTDGGNKWESPSPRYVIRAELGRGGMGVVLRAFDREIERDVALKMLVDDGDALDDDDFRRFVLEAQIAGQLEHPNIVPIHDVGRSKAGVPFFSMKLVDGTDLQTRLSALARAVESGQGDAEFPLRERLKLFGKICDALAFAHERGVIHRDLKPENIMIGAFGDVLVMDWGLAKILDADAAERARRELAASSSRAASASATVPGTSKIAATVRESGGAVRSKNRDGLLQTMEGSISGTPAFMSPEQARGDVGAIDARTDGFALGALLFALVTLTPPWRGESVMEVLASAAKGPMVSAGQRVAEVWGKKLPPPPPALEAIVRTAMHPEPRRRYPSVRALQADVEAFLAYEPVTVWRGNVFDRVANRVRKNPAAAVIAGLIAVLALVVGGGASLYVAETQRAERLLIEKIASDNHAEVARKTAEMAAQTAEMERIQRERIEAQARETTLRELAQRGQLDQLRTALGIKLNYERNQTATEFDRQWQAARQAGVTDELFVRRLGEAKIDEAIAAFEEILRASERFGEVYYEPTDFLYLGLLYHMGRGDLKTALRHYTRGLELAPNHLGMRTNRAILFGAQRQTPEAIADYDFVLAADPANLFALNNRGAEKIRHEDFLGAMRDLDAAIRLDPQFTIAYINRARLKSRLDDMPGAEADFETAIRLNPNMADTYFERGLVRQGAGNHAGALDDYAKTIALAPDFVRAYTIRAGLRARMGDTANALRDFDTAVRLAPNQAELWVSRAQFHSRAKNYPAAIADYDRAIAIDPHDARIFHDRALCHWFSNALSAARADFDEALRLDPSLAMARANRGMLRANTDDLPGALADLDIAVRLEPPNWRSRVNLANVLAMLARRDEAISHYEKALSDAPPAARPQILDSRRQYLGD